MNLIKNFQKHLSTTTPAFAAVAFAAVASTSAHAMIPRSQPASLDRIEIQSLNANSKNGEGLKFKHFRNQLHITLNSVRDGKLRETTYKIPLSYEKDILEAIDGKQGLRALAHSRIRSKGQCSKRSKWKVLLNGQTRYICNDREGERLVSLLYKAGVLHADLTLDPAILAKPSYSIYGNEE